MVPKIGLVEENAEGMGWSELSRADPLRGRSGGANGIFHLPILHLTSSLNDILTSAHRLGVADRQRNSHRP